MATPVTCALSHKSTGRPELLRSVLAKVQTGIRSNVNEQIARQITRADVAIRFQGARFDEAERKDFFRGQA
eukprot:6397976-Pyramimonas_sp.AAC.1